MSSEVALAAIDGSSKQMNMDFEKVYFVECQKKSPWVLRLNRLWVNNAKINTLGCVIVAPLEVIFTIFLFYVKNYLDFTGIHPIRDCKV